MAPPSSVSVGRASGKVFDIEDPPHVDEQFDRAGATSFLMTIAKKNISPWPAPIGKTSQKASRFLCTQGEAGGGEILIRSTMAFQTVKMDAGANKSPSLDQDEDLEGKLEDMSNFALFLSALSYGVLYLFGSANIGRNGNDAMVICLHAWTSVMMVLFFVGSYIRWPARVLKVMRAVMSGVIFVSGLVVFILAHRNM